MEPLAVDRDRGLALHRQLAAQLRDAIRAGQITSRLPSAVDIANASGVNPLTARKALQLLVAEHFAYVEKGMGTYVTSPEKWPEAD
jgi:DNA-binding GntR family transcriptional regulator